MARPVHFSEASWLAPADQTGSRRPRGMTESFHLPPSCRCVAASPRKGWLPPSPSALSFGFPAFQPSSYADLSTTTAAYTGTLPFGWLVLEDFLVPVKFVRRLVICAGANYETGRGRSPPSDEAINPMRLPVKVGSVKKSYAVLSLRASMADMRIGCQFTAQEPQRNRSAPPLAA